jgi:hypothetical protein
MNNITKHWLENNNSYDYYHALVFRTIEPKGSWCKGCLVTAYEAFYYDLKVAPVSN